MQERRIQLAVLLAAAALAVIAGAQTLLRWLHPSGAGALALQAAASSIVLGLAAGAGAALARAPLSERLGLRPGHLAAGPGLLVALGFVAVSHAAESALRLLELREGGALADFDARLTHVGGRALLGVLLGLGVAPGIGEELFFRGFQQRGLEPRLGGLAAVSLSAIAFGALHGDLVHAFAAVVLGLYLGAVTLWSGGIRAAVACHVANNLVAVLEATLDVAPLASTAATLAVGTGLGALGLVVARRAAPRARVGSPPAAGGGPGAGAPRDRGPKRPPAPEPPGPEDADPPRGSKKGSARDREQAPRRDPRRPFGPGGPGRRRTPP